MRFCIDIPDSLLEEVAWWQKQEHCARRAEAIRRLMQSGLRHYKAMYGHPANVTPISEGKDRTYAKGEALAEVGLAVFFVFALTVWAF